jgi:two-component system, OmpR family, response regulator
MTTMTDAPPKVRQGMSIALVDDDSEFVEFLAQYLRKQGAEVDIFPDSNDLLAYRDPYGHDFYVVDLMLPGVDGAELIKVLRRRTDAGLLVVSGRLAPDVFRQAITAGADMYLAKPVQFEQVALAIQAIQRRIDASSAAHTVWRLDQRARQLIAPDGARVDLSDADLAMLECFLDADGGVVERDTLRQRLGRGHNGAEHPDGLNATIYRLRRRIERATPTLVPLQARSRVGYIFKAPLKLA